MSVCARILFLAAIGRLVLVGAPAHAERIIELRERAARLAISPDDEVRQRVVANIEHLRSVAVRLFEQV